MKFVFLGQGTNHKPFVSMTNVATAQFVHCLPVLRKRQVTNRAEGFSSRTVNHYSMSARGKCGETFLYSNAYSYMYVLKNKS